MAVNVDVSDIGTRENRLGSITGYIGNLNDLASRSKNNTLRGCDRCFSQSSSCLNGCVLPMLGQMCDVAVILHGPAGCSSNGSNQGTKTIAEQLGIKNTSVYVGTDVNEKDTIFGSSDKLKDIILEVNRRYKPNAIFVGNACATGIIGEDIESVVEEVRSEIDVPIVATHCEGFKSRIWASGFDIQDQAVLQSGIIQPPKQKRNTVVFKNFFNSARQEITDIFARIDLKPVFLWTNTSVEEVSHLSEATCTTSVCGTLGNYLGNALEELYGVPYIRTINACGITGFEAWFREIAKVAGKEKEAEEYIAEQRAIYIPRLEELKKELEGKTAVIGMGPGYTFEVTRVLDELGMKVLWGLAWHYDKKYEDGQVPPAMEYLLDNDINFDVAVSDQQNYEVMNILNKYHPDIYLSRHPGSTVWATKQGTPAYFVGDEYEIFGYKHTVEFAEGLVYAMKNRSFEENMAKHSKLPYTKWWYEQNIDSFFESGEKRNNNTSI